MARKYQDNSIRARVLALMAAAPNEYLTVDQIIKRGPWSVDEIKQVPPLMPKLADHGHLDREKIKNPAGKGRLLVYGYRPAVRDSAPDEKQQNLMNRRPIKTDPAMRGLSDPPRGKSAAVPSLASAPAKHNAERPKQIFPLELPSITPRPSIIASEEVLVSAIKSAAYEHKGRMTVAQVIGCLHIAGSEILAEQ